MTPTLAGRPPSRGSLTGEVAGMFELVSRDGPTVDREHGRAREPDERSASVAEEVCGQVQRALRDACDELEADIVAGTRRVLRYSEAVQEESTDLTEALRSIGAGLEALRTRLRSAGVVDGSPAATVLALDEVSTRLSRIARSVAGAGALADSLNEHATVTHGAVTGLQRRLVIGLRQSHTGNRRRYERIPISVDATLRLDDRQIACRTLDVSQGGALLRLLDDGPILAGVGRTVELELGRPGALNAVIVGQSEAGLHIAFRRLGPASSLALGTWLHAIRRDYDGLVEFARGIARTVEHRLAEALDLGRVRLSDLVNPDYRIIDGSSPQRRATRASGLFLELAPLLQAKLRPESRVARGELIDRQGFVTLCVASAPPSNDGLPELDAIRSGHFADDKVSLAAARNTRPYLLQGWSASSSGGAEQDSLSGVVVPIQVAEQHWGALRLVVQTRI